MIDNAPQKNYKIFLNACIFYMPTMVQVNDDVPQICDNKLALPLFQITP